jgi:hypothetical protein
VSDETATMVKKQRELDSDDLGSSGYDCMMTKRKKFTHSQLYGSSILIEQSDSNHVNQVAGLMRAEHIDFLSDKVNWKHIAREVNLKECQIVAIDRDVRLNNKLRAVLDLWFSQIQSAGRENTVCYVNKIVEVLTACRLNKIRGLLIYLFIKFLKHICKINDFLFKNFKDEFLSRFSEYQPM